ncbi:MAG: methylmalonyl-CoA mutase, partial [Myxococcales bacterium]
TNERLRFLLDQGQTGLAITFDFPTQMGLDSDSPRSLGEVGMCGVAVDTLRDLDALFRDIPLDRVSTSLAINGPAIVLLGFYIALADERGIARRSLVGTVQNDCLEELIARHAWVLPPSPALRVATDLIAFCALELPRWNTVSISGYPLREAGATAAQELAFALASGLAYVEAGLARGLDLDAFAGRLSFFLDVHSDFFEEIAKLRAARRLWARLLKERHGATRPDTMKLRVHTRTSGASLTAQQPHNNIARVALQALAAVLGGTQSLHTSSLDESHSLPTDDAITVALRTQQIIADESGVAGTIDPLGGSYHVEWLTSRIEREAMAHLERIDELGGMVAAIAQGHPQREIAAASYRLQRQVEQGQRI